ncbi:MAG: hypothetical protein M3247_01385 [Thermoproteota archaeon]|nr:hypothetical protein [Thermoproteota archaeon]
MGRTVPSFRNVLEEERREWKVYRNALDKSERKAFDEMWDIPRLYITACSNSVSLVPLHPIAMSILFYHYKELMEVSKQIEAIKKRKRNKVKEEDKEEPQQEIALQQQKEEEEVEHWARSQLQQQQQQQQRKLYDF